MLERLTISVERLTNEKVPWRPKPRNFFVAIKQSSTLSIVRRVSGSRRRQGCLQCFCLLK